MLTVLLHIITYYHILLHASGFQLDFVAEGDEGKIDIYSFVLSIDLDRHSNEELQPTVPDVVWAKDKAFHPKRTSEDEVLTTISMESLAWKRLALQALVFLVDLTQDLQCPVEVDVSLSLNGRAHLQ